MRWRPSPVTAVVLTLAVGLAGNLAANTVQPTAEWWPPVAWTVVGMLGAAAVVTEWARSRSPALESVSNVDEWAEGLARGVRTLWRREEEHRRIHDPVALPVRWHPAISELADHWANVRRLPAGTPAEPLALSGNIEQLAKIYHSIPSGRLVILGQAGAGKTVLAARLALDLLGARQPHEPVPVIVSAGSWNPKTTALRVWLADQLARDHPGLAAPAGPGGPTRADALIDAGRILPILDGFDEIDAGLHPDALDKLNEITATPIVITSRIEEYTSAVRGADVLTAAAVVELDELTVDDLAAYLPRTAAGHRSGLWDPVLERMRTEPHTPGPATLRQVLANPLMVFLARTIYSDTPGHDPIELLDTHQFPTPQALQEHLLAAFVPAVYQADRPGSTRRRWTADRARRYLTYFAGRLHQAGARDLAWWHLRDTIPRWHRTLIFAVVDGLVTALTAGPTLGFIAGFMDGFDVGPTLGFMHRLRVGLRAGLRAGLTAGLASGLTVALTVGLTKGLRGRLRGEPRFLSGNFTVALGVGLGTAITFALVFTLVFGLADTLHSGLLVACMIGLASAIMAGLIGLRGAGPRPTRTRLQIHGRVRFIASRLVVGFVVGLVVGFPLGFPLGLPPAGLNLFPAGLVFGCAFGLGGALAFALAFGLEVPADAADVVSPAESLAQDRRNTIRKMLAVGAAVLIVVLVAVVIDVLTLGLAEAIQQGLEDTLGLGLVAVVVVGFVSVRPTSAWIYWLVLVRGWLPLTGRLPWRVQAFLTDAYQRGVLRQTGAVYQFRHARLQDHLTTGLRTEATPHTQQKP